MARLIFFGIFVVLASITWVYLNTPPPRPGVDLDEWWGPKNMKKKHDASIRPAKITFDNVMIKDLQDRLKDYRQLAPPLEGINFEYGFNHKQIVDWIKYWQQEYPFAEREKFLNSYPQFKTNIQGLDIHYIHVKPEVPAGVEVVPMLLMHGWPGSVREFYEAIPFLTAVSKDRDFALEVIVPSIPGYGFSDAPVRPGLGIDKVAIIFRNLMQRLGFKKYYVQGGNWGSTIGSNMAIFFPDEVLGYHTNFPFDQSTKSTLQTILGGIYPQLWLRNDVIDRVYPFSEKMAMLIEETGYSHIHASKPDTIGVALSDSPPGLAAYILEKFSTWTNLEHRSLPDGGLSKFTKEQLVDNLMFYWVPNSITTSLRLYAETMNKRYFGLQLTIIPTEVPTWVIQAKHELLYMPACMLRSKYPNLLHETVLPYGGHFLAFELPEVFSEDVLKAVTAFRKWHRENK